jgi:hypothetical protein
VALRKDDLPERDPDEPDLPEWAVEFCREREISDLVRDGRHYEPWGEEDIESVRRAFAALDPNQRAFATKMAKGKKPDSRGSYGSSEGLLIHRYSLSPLSTAYPEMKPRYEVAPKPPEEHWHGDHGPPPEEYDHWAGKEKGWVRKRLRDAQVLKGPSSRCVARPGERECNHAKCSHIRRKKQKPRTEGSAPLFLGDHHGANTEEVHAHQHPAKYIFVTADKVDGPLLYHNHDRRQWRRGQYAKHITDYHGGDYDDPKAAGWHLHVGKWHDHDTHGWRKPENRAKHVRYEHKDGVDVEGVHCHIERVRNPETNMAKVIDCHRLARQKVSDHGVIFFVLEGCPKADSLLSAGAAAISVPSVTLWDYRDGAFAPPNDLWYVTRLFLLNKVVVIVPDADWVHNDKVINQARLLQAKLEHYGVKETHVAAPPLDPDESKPPEDRVLYKGVDDFRHAGGKLEDLVVVDNIPPSRDEIRKWIRRQPQGRRLYLNGLDRDVEALYAFARFAGESGVVEAPLQTVAKAVVCLSYDQIRAAIDSAKSYGGVTIDGDLSTRRGIYTKKEEWEERPRIILHPELRATEVQKRLGDVVELPEFEPVE